MKEKRILITGAGGFIGSHLAKTLYSRGFFVRAADIKWDGYMKEPYYSEKLTLDLRNMHNCLKATEGIDYVYNLAAQMGGIGYITAVGARVMHDNCLINANMLQAAVESKVERFLFTSSACAYPKFKQESPSVAPLKEEDAIPADPDNFYGWEKLFSEKMCDAYRKDYGLKVRIARNHNIYGPQGPYKGGKEKSLAAICRKVAEASNPGEIEIWGDGKQTRSYCYIDDCVEAAVLLMESDYDRPLNIGSDKLVVIDEAADIIIRISGKKIKKRYNLSSPQGVRGRNADLTLAKKILNWQPKVRLEDGLEKTYRWIEGAVNESKSYIST